LQLLVAFCWVETQLQHHFISSHYRIELTRLLLLMNLDGQTELIVVGVVDVTMLFIKVLGVVMTCNSHVINVSTKARSFLRKIRPNSAAQFAQNRPNSATNRGLPFVSKLSSILFGVISYTPFTRSSKRRANVEQTSNKHRANIKQV